MSVKIYRRKFKGEKIPEFYVHSSGEREDCLMRDAWCVETFGGQRYDKEDPDGLDGWWLQSEEEYSLFILRWGKS